MKKWVILLVLLLLLGVRYMYLHQKPDREVQVHEAASSATAGSGSSVQTLPMKKVQMKKVQIEKDQIYVGDLILVNKDHPVHPAGVEPDIVELEQHPELMDGYSLLDQATQLSERVAKQFSAMVAGAGEDGVNHFRISSGYRDNAEQEKMYEEKGSDYALPAGYSEHNLGLSLDIGSTLGAMEHAPEGEWLTKHAWDYGFILRYPKDKAAITGIQYEPWHFRYVGLPHSRIMQEKHLTLEEYLAYLKEQKQIHVTIEGAEYDISYIPISGEMTIEVPKDGDYELSGDNVGGVILTVRG